MGTKLPTSVIIPNTIPTWIDLGRVSAPLGGDAATIAETPSEPRPEHVLQYRFLGWQGRGAQVEFLVAGQVVTRKTVKAEPDGAVRLGLLAGGYLSLARDPDEPGKARAAFQPAGAAYDPVQIQGEKLVIVVGR